jgi:hypothetical protein
VAAVLSYKRERSSACSLFSRHSNRYFQCQDWLGRLAWNTNNIFLHSIRTTRFRTFIFIYLCYWGHSCSQDEDLRFSSIPLYVTSTHQSLGTRDKAPYKGHRGLIWSKKSRGVKKKSQISARLNLTSSQINVLASFDLQLEFFGQPARNSVYEDEVYFKFTVRDLIYTSSSKTALKAKGFQASDSYGSFSSAVSFWGPRTWWGRNFRETQTWNGSRGLELRHWLSLGS